MAMSSVVYGAGNIGRGFIGMLFAASGYEVTFIDVDAALVDMLNEAGEYPVRSLSDDPEANGRDTWVRGVSAVAADDVDAVARATASADIAATCVGARALENVAPLIAKGLLRRYAGGGGPLNILICENIPDPRAQLSAWLEAAATSDAERGLIAENTGLVETSIGRMTPEQTDGMRDGNPLRVSAEPYAALPVDAEAFKGRIPDIKGMTPYGGFDYYVKRKLFLHNMGHAVCAYLGIAAGYTYISDAIRDEEIKKAVKTAMEESAEALSIFYSADPAELAAHVDDLIARFGNAALLDSCERVGVDAERKLGPSERFMGAIELCRRTGVSCPGIEAGAAAARLEMDKQAAIHSPR
ncbi:MAG: mannitol dehydrogenase [Clostridiales Family XIII bacterium]|jgi:mannitol-1-phosphate 5-dehydrogenase|nr:mannitol dehydrogenase [Clostridiales Family XIII bacterium]